MYDFYPPISAYVIPLLSFSWPKRCTITLLMIGSLMSAWYLMVYKRLIGQYHHQQTVLEKTKQEYSHLPALKKQIARFQHDVSQQPKHHRITDASTALLSLCATLNLTVAEYDNQSESLPGTITTRGRFDDQYTLLEKLQGGVVGCTYCLCRVERIDNDMVAMTLSFNVSR